MSCKEVNVGVDKALVRSETTLTAAVLKAMSDKLDKVLESETNHSLTKWLKNRRKINKKTTKTSSQIKSKERVRDLGEVFTNEREVNAMLDLIPNITIEMTFLEPSCGNGNFLIEILRRKLNLISKEDDTPTAILKCYASIYGVDIMPDNVTESKQRMLDMLPMKELEQEVKTILDNQIIVGDFLKMYGYEETKKKRKTKKENKT